MSKIHLEDTTDFNFVFKVTLGVIGATVVLAITYYYFGDYLATGFKSVLKMAKITENPLELQVKTTKLVAQSEADAAQLSLKVLSLSQESFNLTQNVSNLTKLVKNFVKENTVLQEKMEFARNALKLLYHTGDIKRNLLNKIPLHEALKKFLKITS